jgi:hypothetical protein
MFTWRLWYVFAGYAQYADQQGVLFTYGKKGRPTPPPGQDPKYMLNVITSAIVNTPPPAGAAAMVAFLAGNKHRTLRKSPVEASC